MIQNFARAAAILHRMNAVQARVKHARDLAHLHLIRRRLKRAEHHIKMVRYRSVVDLTLLD
jgi:hypothetical protein